MSFNRRAVAIGGLLVAAVVATTIWAFWPIIMNVSRCPEPAGTRARQLAQELRRLAPDAVVDANDGCDSGGQPFASAEVPRQRLVQIERQLRAERWRFVDEGQYGYLGQWKKPASNPEIILYVSSRGSQSLIELEVIDADWSSR